MFKVVDPDGNKLEFQCKVDLLYLLTIMEPGQ
jgi:hypothetical protein